METDNKKPGRGRPKGTGKPLGRKVSEPGAPYGAPQMLLRLPPDLMEWVREQGGPAYVRQMLEQARAAAN